MDHQVEAGHCSSCQAAALGVLAAPAGANSGSEEYAVPALQVVGRTCRAAAVEPPTGTARVGLEGQDLSLRLAAMWHPDSHSESKPQAVREVEGPGCPSLSHGWRRGSASGKIALLLPSCIAIKQACSACAVAVSE